MDRYILKVYRLMSLSVRACALPGHGGYEEDMFGAETDISGSGSSSSSSLSSFTDYGNIRSPESTERYRWRNKLRLPPTVTRRSQICVKVNIAGSLLLEHPNEDLLYRTEEEIRGILHRTYTASYEQAELILSVYLVLMTDGGWTDTIAGASSSNDRTAEMINLRKTTLESANSITFGEAAVGLAWRIHSKCDATNKRRTGTRKEDGPTTGEKSKPIIYDRGMILRKQPLSEEELFLYMTSTNPGRQCVLEQLAPECAYDVISCVGIGATQFYDA